jgi:hypothetical protein
MFREGVLRESLTQPSFIRVQENYFKCSHNRASHGRHHNLMNKDQSLLRHIFNKILTLQEEL